MKDQIEKLKDELRSFITLSKVITPGKWNQLKDGNAGDNNICQYIQAENSSLVAYGYLTIENAIFIARSRNISPAMADCLLHAVEALEVLLASKEANATNYILQKILAIWEAAK